MQIGDLVKFVGQLGLGVIVDIRVEWNDNHNHKVLFSGTGYEKLDGYHWCNPTCLEVICK